LVIYSNHASWWDPLVGLVLKTEYFPDRRAFAPMDAAALERYQMFRRLGFFAVEQGSRRGAVQFLRTCEAVLRDPNHVLALTPQGQFVDARERPARFQAGLGYLAARVHNVAFVPMAAEYVFWEERLPEILVRFGEAVVTDGGQNSTLGAGDWTTLLEQELVRTQDALALESRRRNPDEFQMLLRGRAGQGGVYDWWRACKAWWRGTAFNPEHGSR